MKRGYSKKTYHQRSKDETIFSVIKRTMGDEVRSIGVKAQNNEMRMKIISYNAARIANLACSLLRGFLQSPDTQQNLWIVFHGHLLAILFQEESGRNKGRPPVSTGKRMTSNQTDDECGGLVVGVSLRFMHIRKNEVQFCSRQNLWTVRLANYNFTEDELVHFDYFVGIDIAKTWQGGSR